MKFYEDAMPYSFGAGFVQNRNTARVIARFDELVEDGSASSILMMWSQKKRQWGHFNLGWTAVRISTTKSQMFALGSHGVVMVADMSGVREEIIEETNSATNPPYRDMCLIDNHLYVVGEGGRVQRRAGNASWSACNLGIDPTTDINAIHGLKEGDLYIAGQNGEIWKLKNGTWQRIQCPVDKSLLAIRAAENGKVYAAGEGGTLLVQQDGRFEVLGQDLTNDNISSLEWFKGKLYIAQEDALFVLQEDQKLSRVNFGLGPWWSSGHLHANDGVLWSFGSKHIAWTEDGIKWNNVTPAFSAIDTVSEQTDSSCSCADDGCEGHGGFNPGSYTGGGHHCS